MATAESVKNKLQNLIVLANNTTGKSDVDLTTAMGTLVEGFGKGGINTSDANATPSDILKDKVAYANDERIVGSIETFDGSYECSDESTGGGYDEGYATGKAIADGIISRTITEIESDVSEVGAHVLYTCKELIKVSLPNATILYDNCLRDCIKLVDIYIPNAEILRGGSLRGCQNLITVDLPKVNTMYANVFTGCTRLTTLILRADTVCSMTNVNVLQSTPIESGTGFVYVKDELVEQYKSATNWTTYASQIKPLSELV